MSSANDKQIQLGEVIFKLKNLIVSSRKNQPTEQQQYKLMEYGESENDKDTINNSTSNNVVVDNGNLSTQSSEESNQIVKLFNENPQAILLVNILLCTEQKKRVLVEHVWIQQTKNFFDASVIQEIKKIEESLVHLLEQSPVAQCLKKMGEHANFEFEYEFNKLAIDQQDIEWTRLGNIDGLLFQYGKSKRIDEILSKACLIEEDNYTISNNHQAKQITNNNNMKISNNLTITRVIGARQRFGSEDLTHPKKRIEANMMASERERKLSYPPQTDSQAKTRPVSQKFASIYSQVNDVTIISTPEDDMIKEIEETEGQQFEMLGLDDDDNSKKKKKNNNNNNDSIEIILGGGNHSQSHSEKQQASLQKLSNNLTDVLQRQSLKFEERGLFKELKVLQNFYDSKTKKQ